ncbi:hypothetical protein BDB01DRAFT_795464 [Pilobolus umbonatus]|nr:hypothetical protein BDB01DRAFT_795464 [Pilobolus umbonatus]
MPRKSASKQYKSNNLTKARQARHQTESTDNVIIISDEKNISAEQEVFEVVEEDWMLNDLTADEIHSANNAAVLEFDNSYL